MAASTSLHRPRGRRPALLAGFAAAALIAAGCSSSSSPSTSSGGSPAASSAGSTAAAGVAVVGTTSGSLGTYLVDGRGMALYLWDADKSDSSTCYDACAKAWPPLLTSGSPTASGQADASKLGTTKRKDGSMQVTYAGHPLYYYFRDTKPGDTSGQGSNGFGAPWWLVSPAGTPIVSMPSTPASGGYNY